MNSQGIDISSGLVPKAPPDITAGLIPRDMASQDPLAQKANASQILDRSASLNPAGFGDQSTSTARLSLGMPPAQAPPVAEQQLQSQVETRAGAPLQRQTTVNIPSTGPVAIAPKFVPRPDQAKLAAPAQDNPIGYQQGEDRPE